MTADIRQIFINAVGLHQAGRRHEAEILYHQVLAAVPGHADSLHLLGVLSLQNGKPSAAVALIAEALRRDGGRPAYAVNMAMALKASGDLEGAAACCVAAAQANPDTVDIHFHHALIRHEIGQTEAAITGYRRTVALRPDHLEAYYNQGTALLALERLGEGAGCLQHAARLAPDHAESRFKLGMVLRPLGRLAESVTCHHAVLALQPDSPGVINSLGIVLKETGGLEAAVTAFQRALRLNPDFPAALNNLCATWQELGRPDLAVAVFEQAVAAPRRQRLQGPENHQARLIYIWALLAAGRLAEGWTAHKQRWTLARESEDRHHYPFPVWDGRPTADGALLVVGEQGLGDEIMFAGLLPDVLALGQPLALENDRRLHPLLARSFPGARLFARKRNGDAGTAPSEITGVSAHIAAGDLPSLFRRGIADFPPATVRRPYLIADPEATAAARRRHDGDRYFLIGLSWRSQNPDHGPGRSIMLERLAGALDAPGVRLVSLQYGDVAADRAAATLAGASVVDDPLDTTEDIDGLAALTAAMDLVVTIDNTTAHLSGALGKTTWTLLPFAADWRWMTGRDDSPWYPSLRLFRQDTRGDWNPVLRRVAAALAALRSAAGDKDKGCRQRQAGDRFFTGFPWEENKDTTRFPPFPTMALASMSSDVLVPLFDQAVNHRHDLETQMTFCRALAQTVGWEEQKAWFEKLAAAAPDSETAALAFIETCCRAGMGNPVRPAALAADGAAILDRAVRTAPATPHRPLIMGHLAYLYNELGNFPAAEAAARQAHGGTNAIYHFWLAEALYEQRKFINDPACAIDLSTLRVEHFQELVNQLQAERAGRPYVPGELLYQFSGDAVYFRRFVVPQTLSLARLGRPCRIHFHVFDPDGSTHPLAERLARTLPHFHFTLTTEPVNLPDIHSKRSYYAFARYLRAYDRFRDGYTVVVADADLLFRADPQVLVDQTEGYDAGIVKFEGQPLSNRYNASFVVFRQTMMAELLLKALDRFLKIQFSKPSLIWILDQISLYCCIRRLIEVTSGQAKVLEWPEETICIQQLDTSPIWNGATNRKWTDSPYNRLRTVLLTEYGFSSAEIDV